MSPLLNDASRVGIALWLAVCAPRVGLTQNDVIVPDIAEIASGDDWTVANREARAVDEGIYLEARVAWLETLDFATGTIEVDIKGSDERGRSFVGIAFRGVDESTYDAIYFRPFNFRSDDPARRGHSVQYISHPDHTWRSLREGHPEKYENPVEPAPDPNAFFHATVVVEASKVSVFVNGADDPCLVVEPLSDRSRGWIGLWTGNNSDGTFANLKITPGR